MNERKENERKSRHHEGRNEKEKKTMFKKNEWEIHVQKHKDSGGKD